MDTIPPLRRGVYRSPFLSKSGHVQLVGVDRYGRKVCNALLFHRDSEDAVSIMLERVLDEHDPHPN